MLSKVCWNYYIDLFSDHAFAVAKNFEHRMLIGIWTINWKQNLLSTAQRNLQYRVALNDDHTWSTFNSLFIRLYPGRGRYGSAEEWMPRRALLWTRLWQEHRLNPDWDLEFLSTLEKPWPSLIRGVKKPFSLVGRIRRTDASCIVLTVPSPGRLKDFQLIERENMLFQPMISRSGPNMGIERGVLALIKPRVASKS